MQALCIAYYISCGEEDDKQPLDFLIISPCQYFLEHWDLVTIFYSTDNCTEIMIRESMKKSQSNFAFAQINF